MRRTPPSTRKGTVLLFCRLVAGAGGWGGKQRLTEPGLLAPLRIVHCSRLCPVALGEEQCWVKSFCNSRHRLSMLTLPFGTELSASQVQQTSPILMDQPPHLRALPGWDQGSEAASPQRWLPELPPGSGGWRLRGNRGRGCGEVQSPLPRRTCHSGRFSSKPCFNVCVNLEPSEKCSFCWT